MKRFLSFFMYCVLFFHTVLLQPKSNKAGQSTLDIAGTKQAGSKSTVASGPVGTGRLWAKVAVEDARGQLTSMDVSTEMSCSQDVFWKGITRFEQDHSGKLIFFRAEFELQSIDSKTNRAHTTLDSFYAMNTGSARQLDARCASNNSLNVYNQPLETNFVNVVSNNTNSSQYNNGFVSPSYYVPVQSTGMTTPESNPEYWNNVVRNPVSASEKAADSLVMRGALYCLENGTTFSDGPYSSLAKSLGGIPYASQAKCSQAGTTVRSGSRWELSEGAWRLQGDFQNPYENDANLFGINAQVQSHDGSSAKPKTFSDLKLPKMPAQKCVTPQFIDYAHEYRQNQAELYKALGFYFNVARSAFHLVVATYRWVAHKILGSVVRAKFKDWSQEDFKKEALKKAYECYPGLEKTAYHDRCLLHEHQHSLLSEYELYQFDGYQKFMATLPSYEEYIINLHRRIVADQAPYHGFFGRIKRIWTTLWWDNLVGYNRKVKFPKVVEKQYEAVMKIQELREQEEERIAKQEEARLKREQLAREKAFKKEQAEQELRAKQEKAKAEARWAYEQALSEKQKNVLQCVQDKYEYLESCAKKYQQVLQQSDISEQDAERLKQRIKAIIQTVEDNHAFESESYPFSQRVVDFLSESCLESDAFSADDKAALAVILDHKYMILDGLPIQHCMQKEVMTIFDTAADIHHSQSKNSTTLLHAEAVGKMCYLASEYIQEGFVTVAMQIVDHALVQGLIAGKNAALDGLIYVQEETVEKLYGAVKDGARQVKSGWQERTKGIDSGLSSYAVDVGNGVIDSIEGTASLLEMGGHAIKAAEDGTLTALASRGVQCAAAGVKCIGAATWGAVKDIDKGLTHAKANPKEFIDQKVSDLGQLLSVIKELPVKDIVIDEYRSLTEFAENGIQQALGFAKSSWDGRSLHGAVRFVTKTAADGVSGKIISGPLKQIAPLVLVSKISGNKQQVQSAVTTAFRDKAEKAISDEFVAKKAADLALNARINASRAELVLSNQARFARKTALKEKAAKIVASSKAQPGAAAGVVENASAKKAIYLGQNANINASGAEKLLSKHAQFTGKKVTNTAQRWLPEVIDKKKISKKSERLFTRASCRSGGCKAVHLMHSKKELRNALIYLRNNPLSITPHELIPFDTPHIDMHGLMHILGIEMKKVWSKKLKKLVDKISGFHFSPNGRMDKYLKNKVIDKMTGIIEVAIEYGGLEPVKNKTFFPPSWTIEKLLSEIQSAMLNATDILIKEGGRIEYTGLGSTGIEIKMVFEKTGKLVTAFPVLNKNKGIGL